MAVKFANNVSTTLSAAINATQTTISVADASGLPTLSSGDYIYLTIDTDTNSPTIEVVKVTGVSTNTLTVVRGQDGTTASSFSSGVKVELRVTAAGLDDISAQAQSAADTESVSISGDTMTGALTTPGLTVNGNAILGSTAANYDQYIRGNGNVGLRIQTNAQGITSGDGMRIGLNGVHAFVWQFEALPLAFATSGTERLSISATGAFDFKGGSFSNVGTISSGAITTSGPVNVTGNSSYVGDYGYNTLTLQESSGYVGLNFRHGNKNWLIRKNGVSDDLQFVYSDNASAANTGTYTELLKILHDGGFDFKGGAFSDVGTISSGAITTSANFLMTGGYSIYLGTTSRFSSDNNGGFGINYGTTGGTATASLSIYNNTTATIQLNRNGTISSGAITSTGTSYLGSQTLYISTDNYIGVNTSAHVGTVLNVLDVDDEDVTLRLHTNTNSHKPVIRMNAKNSAGNAQYGDIKWNPDSPSFNFHVPYNEATPTLQILDGAISVDGTISSGAITSSSTIRANDWFRGASDTNALYSDNSNGTIIQTPSNTNDNAGMFRVRDGQGVVHFSINTNTNEASFHGGNISSGAIASGVITATGEGHTFYNSSNSIKFGRNANENIQIIVTDGTNKIVATQDSDDDSGHDFVLDRIFNASAGSSNFYIRNAGSNQLSIDKNANVTIAGNLTVQGTTTTIDTANLNVEDNNITLNYSTGDSSGSANGAGITIQDAVNSTTDATILWDATNDEFDFSHPVKVAGSLGVTNIVTNKVVKHNGTIFDDSNITDTGSLITLGSAATVSGTLQSNDITIIGGTGTTSVSTLTLRNYADTAHLKSRYTNPSTTTETYLAFHTNKAGEENGTVSESMRLSGNDLSVNGKIKATDLQVFKELPAGGGDYETYHWNQVHAAFSDYAGANTYIILDTAVPQDSSSMGGFTLICFNEYDDESEGDVVQIYGYFTPESNGGFNGFRYVCSNPDFEPTIQVGRNSSGNTAFLIGGFDDTRYAVMVARDLYLGYLANNAAASWGDGWAFSQASSTSGYSNLDTLERIGISDTQVSNWNTAYTYSQVGHLPLTGGSLTGSLSAANTIVGDQTNISMDANANGQLEIRGNGYTGAIALDSNDMHLYHNSVARGIVFGTNEINRVRITSGGDLETYYDLNTYAAHKYYVSTSDAAHQRADARDESGTLSRLHWYGVNDSGGTSNFRHAWYDGDSYINVTANGNNITFDHSTIPLSLTLRSISGTSNPVYMVLEGRNSSSQQFALEIANRGNHVTSSFTDKIDFSINNNGTYYYSALRFDIYGGVETKQHIGNADSPYAGDDRYFKFTNDTASASGTLVTADNGNTWLNADGGKDLWLNWYSLNNSTSHADLRVGDGDGGGAVLSVVGVDRRVGILDTTPSYPLDVAGDIRGTGMVRADSGINVHSGRISTTSSNQTGGGNVETYYQPDGNNNHTWRLIAGGTNTGYGTGVGGLGFYYQNSGGAATDYNLILKNNQTSRFFGRVDIENDNIGAEPYSGLIVRNTATSGDRLGGITIDAQLQTHYRYMLGGALKWQTRVGSSSATDDWRLYSWTTASDILTVKPSGEGQLRLFKTGSSTQWTDTSGTGSIAISGYGAQSSGSNPTVTFSAGNGGYAMFYLNRMISGSETFSNSSARYFDFYRNGTSKVRMVMSASDDFGFYHATSTASTNVWGSGGTNFLEVADTGTTTLYALNVSNSAQVGGSNIFHAGYSNTWAQIPAGTRTDYDLKFKPAQGNYAGLDFRDYNNGNAGYLLMKGAGDALPAYKANGISLIADAGWLTLAQRTTTDTGIRFVTQNTTNVDERGRFDASGDFLVGTTNTSGLVGSSIRAAGTIDTGIGGSGAFRFYDGSTFRGGFGTNQWATGAAASNNLAILGTTGSSLFIYTNNDDTTPKFAFGADGVLYPYSTRWDRTYHQVDAYASGASTADVHTHWGVLCAGSDNGTPLAYTIIETNVDQDSYRMGGFTILLMDAYGDHKTRARIDLAGYWNPESNGGFIGWGYTTTNPRERPTIYIMRNSTTGKVAFAYQHSAVAGASYPVILACDLWLGYSGAAEADGKNWSIKQQTDLTGYTNTDQVYHVGGNGNYQNNDGSFVISKSSGTMFSHGAFSDAIGYNPSYGTYVGAGGRYVYSGTSSAGNSGSHPYYSNGFGVFNILHDGGQIANTYNGDHTFTTTTGSAGIKVSNNQTGGPAIKIHSTNTNGTDWWLISNSSSNTDGAGKLQLWSNNNSFTAATFGETNQDITSIYTPTRIILQNQPPTFTTHTSGSTRPTLLANPDGQGAHALVVNQPHSGYWAQIISTQRYGLNIDSHSSDSSTYLLNCSIAGLNQFYVRGDGVIHHRTTTLHGVQGSVMGNAYYYADADDGANIDYYAPNGTFAHMDCRNDGNHSKLHKYTLSSVHSYGSYKEAWWDGDSYHEIGSISNAIRTNGDFVASGNITAYGSYSDRRLKENIRPFENARELIKDINVHQFNYIGKDDDLIGVIAQEVEETLPQLVYELVDTDSDEVRKAVRYDHLSAVLLKVVKEQDEEIQELKALVHSLLEKIK